ncbi:beta-ketoacyl-ACP synthase II [Pleionea sp. CnH1-48]|uniref:beta-ketoacyl-ACP synthase II n=1 Tax=Pleionea sp. CnH1-48 TaxID=2954494 RepID=UPI0020972C80|nr:beta-ketoacyl-ACP synthase II [Pleionea sp. CnH1-48]MCO7225887.1 beta-ketoacyl-ACP synthase II [Pleionea sp. CnH1-48]
MNRRVVITGMGLLSPLGEGVSVNWEALLEGRSGISNISKFDTSEFPIKIAGEIKSDLLDHFSVKDKKKIDPFIQYALVAAKEAIADANLTQKEGVGVIIGSGQGGINNIEEQQARVQSGRYNRVTPYFIPSSVIGMAAGHVSAHFGFDGPSYGVSSACATSAHAIIDACKTIRLGEADVMIAGGSEATITPLSLAGFARINALSHQFDTPETASRPFDRERDGFVSSEGAGILVLEELESALRRNAPIYAEIGGYGMSSDAFHATAPHPEAHGQIKALDKALRSSNTNAKQVDYINAHGTSTALNDRIETKAIKKTFGEHAKKLSISSTKSMTGHMLGAAGATELIFSAKTIEKGIIPPTINLHNADPDCDLDYTPNEAKTKNVDVCLSNSFGFGGTNTSILLKKVS